MFHNISDKLIAVNYPYSWDDDGNSGNTNTADFRNLRDIVIFLEDTILRTLPIQSRAAIKNTSSSKKEFYQALHDYCDCSNNTNIIKLSGGGSAFMRSSSSSDQSSSSSSCVAGMNKLLSDLKDDTSTGKSDLAAVVLIDRLLDLAIAQIVEDKSMNLEAAHAKWQDEQGKRNVTTLDLSNSLMMMTRSKKQEEETGKAKNKSSSSAVSKAIAEILACRTSSTVKSSSSSSSLSQIGAASRFAVGLVDFDHHQNICAKVEELQQQENNKNNTNSKPIRGSPSSFSFHRLNLNDEWTKVALSEIPLFGEARVTYDQNTAPKKKLEKLSSSSTNNNNNSISDHDHHLLQNCARALRAIYTEDFSALQRRINVSLARLQELTATCATDPKLGRTGR